MRNKNIQIFNNPDFGQVRTIAIEGEPWLVGKDVALVLGYTNPQKAIRDHIDAEDTTVNESFTVNGTKGILINESGLYALALSSKLPTAKKFKRWVTSEVLPQIRQTGGYIPMQGGDMEDNEIMARALLIANKTIEVKNKKISELNQTIENDRPKVIFADSVAASDTTILVGELAKIIQQNGHAMGQKRLFAWMRENGYLIKRKGCDYNIPTQRAMEMGLFRIKETSVTCPDGHVRVSKTPKVTGKGQQYFVNAFKKGDIKL